MKFLNRLLVIFVITFLTACSGSGTVNVGNPDTSTIKISKLSLDGRVEITIPEELFGGADEIDSATFLVEVNQEDTGELSASDFYESDEAAVVYTASNVEDGDTITVAISRNSSTVTYSGTVSDSEETEATEVTDDGAEDPLFENVDAFMVFTLIDSSSGELTIDLSHEDLAPYVGGEGCLYLATVGTRIRSDNSESRMTGIEVVFDPQVSDTALDDSGDDGDDISEKEIPDGLFSLDREIDFYLSYDEDCTSHNLLLAHVTYN